MALMIGIDTGGTYTDAVLYDDAAPGPGVAAKAKALTTRHDLALGIGAAIDRVLTDRAPEDIAMVSLSTTLATNALVEGQGGRVCLILIGFDEAALDRAGLGAALGTDPVVFIAGGHTATGERQTPLDLVAADAAIATHAGMVDGFAVISHFGSRDPVDEIAVRDRIHSACARPVTCGHELAARLGGPKRALTALLNARLIGMISDLIAAAEAILTGRGITAPLMLVRGDGSLVSGAFARERPIETILSGPAASLVGAAHLTGRTDAVISDIGGTTTDIAILRGGRPALSPDGAAVGGHHTMVEAVAMTTHGLGGDSAVRIDETSLTPRLILGPRRIVPLGLLGLQHPDIAAVLEHQLAKTTPGEWDGQFVFRYVAARGAETLRDADRALLDSIPETPVPIGDVVRSRLQGAALNRLVGRGMVRASGFTPTDAAEVLELHDGWDREAARTGAMLMARRRDAAGRAVAETPEAFAAWVRATLERRSAELLLDAALAADGIDMSDPSLSPLGRAALDGHDGAARIGIGLELPLIGLGASAPVYYPGIARLLGTEAVISDHADVANAVGAVVGQVRIQHEITISSPVEGRYRTHAASGTEDFPDLDRALAYARHTLSDEVRKAAERAGAEAFEMSEDWAPRLATVEGKALFIEGTLRIMAVGRPRLST